MRRIGVLLLLVIAGLSGCSRQMPPGQVAAWLPDRPQAGGEITLFYNPAAPGAVLVNETGLTAEMLIMRTSEPPIRTELPMAQKDGVWRTRHLLPAEGQFFLLRFAANGKTDDNGGRCWEGILHGREMRPLRGAHLQKSLLLQQGGAGGFPFRQSLSEAETELEAELALYPDNLEAKTALWDLLLRRSPLASTKERVRNELRQIYENAGGDEETLAALLPFFFRTGQEYAARQIIAESVALLPRGPVAAAARRREIEREQDPIKKASMIEAYNKEFTQRAFSPLQP
ncbi:MAG TPA: hypothetical protein PKJ13_09835 [bacterium]|nr:hypothetical protein [bacterium]